jgi:hypothetical protein
VAVVNEALMGNHQTELAEELAGRGHLRWCKPADVGEALREFQPNGEEGRGARPGAGGGGGGGGGAGGGGGGGVCGGGGGVCGGGGGGGGEELGDVPRAPAPLYAALGLALFTTLFCSQTHSIDDSRYCPCNQYDTPPEVMQPYARG